MDITYTLEKTRPFDWNSLMALRKTFCSIGINYHTKTLQSNLLKASVCCVLCVGFLFQELMLRVIAWVFS